MKIAHVSPYDHQVAGGVREHVVNLDRQFRALGHDVTIIAPASRRGRTSALPAANVVRISDWVTPVPGSGSIARISLDPRVYGRIGQADAPTLEAGQTVCCYAKSEKTWVTDPAGIPWEAFLTTGESTVYGGERPEADAAACCTPTIEAPCCGLAETPKTVAETAACCG